MASERQLRRPEQFNMIMMVHAQNYKRWVMNNQLYKRSGQIKDLHTIARLIDNKDAAVAVNVLSHEAWHLAGERNESVAQCYALQSNEDTAIRLGATAAEARAIADFVVRRVQPVLPPEYKTTECRDGGPLDLDPARTGWP